MIKKLIAVPAVLIFILSPALVLADTDYTLKNDSGDKLVFDKTWGQSPKCSIDIKSSTTITQGQEFRFDIDRHPQDCTWGGVGLKVFYNDQYIGYLSVNVRHEPGLGDNWFYSYEYDNGPNQDFGSATSGSFIGS